MKKFILILLITSSVTKIYAQKFDGLALTPPMGWNSWNTFAVNINEKLVMEIADKMVSSGMKDAGYSCLVLDDGWMAMARDKDGNLIADPVKFPHGMKMVADYVHSKGLKFGLYNCAGTKTCGGYPGTRGYEYQDARLYAAIGIDYLKFDWCNTDGINAKEAYTTMSLALRAAGRPIIFSLCEWGNSKPWLWATPVGHLWRTTTDITNQFEGIKSNGSWSSFSVMKIVDLQDALRKFAGPGHWNDPDMLEVGKGMTAGEDRAHFSMWCMLAAPLIAGNDIRAMSRQTLDILTNKEAISVDQDSLGIEAFKYEESDSLRTYIKPTKGGLAVCFLNTSSHPVPLGFDWKVKKIKDAVSNVDIDFTANNYLIYNIWEHKNEGNTKKVYRNTVNPHDVVMLILKKPAK